MFRRLAPVLAAGLVLAACGSGDAEPTTAPAATTAPAPATDTAGDGGTPAAPAALQFSAPLIGGGDIELTTLAGRPVLLWFWAPW